MHCTSEVASILDALESLAYTAPEEAPPTMTEPLGAAAEDTLGRLLSGVLGNLVGRLSPRGNRQSGRNVCGEFAW